MKKVKLSLIFNLLIVIVVLIGSIFMFTGFKFMPDKTLLQVSSFEMFKFFTVDSNILMGIVSLVLVFYLIKLLKGKINSIPSFVYILKYVGTVSITITFVTTLFFLSPSYGFYAMYNNSNLFFHMIVPVLAIISYVFFEEYDNKYRYLIYGMIPMFIYTLYYSFMILIHLSSDGLTFKYDFYGFLQGDISNIYIVVPVMFLFSCFISLLLIFLNKKLSK